jgi:hypothetical protein
MNNKQKNVGMTLTALFFSLGLMACSQGPAEEAGEELDETIEEVGNAVEDACEDIKDAAKAKDKDC